MLNSSYGHILDSKEASKFIIEQKLHEEYPLPFSPKLVEKLGLNMIVYHTNNVHLYSLGKIKMGNRLVLFFVPSLPFAGPIPSDNFRHLSIRKRTQVIKDFQNYLSNMGVIILYSTFPLNLKDARPYQFNGWDILPNFTYLFDSTQCESILKTIEEPWLFFKNKKRRNEVRNAFKHIYIKKGKSENYNSYFSILRRVFINKGKINKKFFKTYEKVMKTIFSDNEVKSSFVINEAYWEGELVAFEAFMLTKIGYIRQYAGIIKDKAPRGTSTLLLFRTIVDVCEKMQNNKKETNQQIYLMAANVPELSNFMEDFTKNIDVFFHGIWAKRFLKPFIRIKKIPVGRLF